MRAIRGTAIAGCKLLLLFSSLTFYHVFSLHYRAQHWVPWTCAVVCCVVIFTVLKVLYVGCVGYLAVLFSVCFIYIFVSTGVSVMYLSFIIIIIIK